MYKRQLYDLLKSHPQIFLSVLKEPQFFSDDVRFARGMAYYEREHFARVREPARGEATPHYLVYEKVARRIRDTIPPEGHRFIVILRDPVQRAYSLYWNMVAEGVEPLSFEEALATEPARASDPTLDLEGRGSIRFLYFQSGLYGRQIEGYLRHFARERFLILRFEDLQRAPLEVARKVFDFLDVSTEHLPVGTERSNPAGEPRSRALHRFLRQSHWSKEMLKRALPTELRHRAIQGLLAWNRRARDYPPMDAAVERELRRRFSPDLELLSDRTGIDFSDWMA